MSKRQQPKTAWPYEGDSWIRTWTGQHPCPYLGGGEPVLDSNLERAASVWLGWFGLVQRVGKKMEFPKEYYI
jgi:hypothetical protein